jgi:hypothetical protein
VRVSSGYAFTQRLLLYALSFSAFSHIRGLISALHLH